MSAEESQQSTEQQMEFEVSRTPNAPTASEALAAEGQPQGNQSAAPSAEQGANEGQPGAEKAPAAAAGAATQAATENEYGWVKDNPIAQQALLAVKNGDIAGFAKNFSVDYDAASNEDLIRMKIEKENPGAPANVINSLYAKEMSQYDLGSFDDEKKESSAYLLQQAANKIRDGFKEAQKAYQIPQSQGQPQVSEADKARFAETETYLTTHPALLAFETNAKLEVGTGEDKFQFAAPTGLNKEAVLNTDLMAQLWSEPDANGKQTFDMPKFLRMAAYAQSPEAFEAALINHGKLLGAKANFLDRHNPGERIAGQIVGAEGEAIEVYRSR